MPVVPKQFLDLILSYSRIALHKAREFNEMSIELNRKISRSDNKILYRCFRLWSDVVHPTIWLNTTMF